MFHFSTIPKSLYFVYISLTSPTSKLKSNFIKILQLQEREYYGINLFLKFLATLYEKISKDYIITFITDLPNELKSQLKNYLLKGIKSLSFNPQLYSLNIKSIKDISLELLKIVDKNEEVYYVTFDNEKFFVIDGILDLRKKKVENG